MTNNINSDSIKVLGASGALNSDSKEASLHAELYYEEIRKRNSDVKNISKNTGISIKKIQAVKNHVFLTKHNLDSGYDYFRPDYCMAQAWQRLIEGKEIRKSDLILIEHEYLDSQYMAQGMNYNEAHNLTNEKYNWWLVFSEEEKDKNGEN